jgi:hypothetical protein
VDQYDAKAPTADVSALAAAVSAHRSSSVERGTRSNVETERRVKNQARRRCAPEPP